MKLKIFFSAVITVMAFSFNDDLFGQTNTNYIRIANLVIDSTKLEDYKKALKEHAEMAVKVEPGVIMLYAVYEKENPTNVSVFEIYANEEAYKFHIKTQHFLKYKAIVQDMVKSLQLIDVTPIALESKLKLLN
ncbi:MAG TPA: antibiotic biosynthesis monooxygenase [Chitinophagaceae bacterium]|nr:antibiotic biosynthesis monooxygenase [Chitinophagaceae bacterium]